jgi:hypothetical protein
LLRQLFNGVWGKKKGSGEGERSVEEKEKGTFILSEKERDLL